MKRQRDAKEYRGIQKKIKNTCRIIAFCKLSDVVKDRTKEGRRRRKRKEERRTRKRKKTMRSNRKKKNRGKGGERRMITEDR